MSNYEKQNFVSGQILKAEHLNHMEDGIGQLSEEIVNQGKSIDKLSEGIVQEKPMVYIDGEIPTTKDNVLATMTVKSGWLNVFAYIKIKCQGSSSMDYPKKNFTVTLYQDEARTIPLEITIPGWKLASNKFVLKANYIDHLHARNIISARLWSEIVASRPDYDTLPEEFRNSPNNGAVDGFPIVVYANGAYQGIYTWNIGKEDWLWGMDEDDPNHVLMCAETNTNGVYAETACNFRALWDGVNESYWSVEVGENSEAVKNALNALISCVKDTTDDEFVAQIENHLDIQSAIDYYIFACCNCGIDSLGKNMLLGTYDLHKWIMGAYDLDSTWGLWWNGSKFISAATKCPDEYQERYSLLFERVEKLFRERMTDRAKELRQTVLSEANVLTHYERFVVEIGEKSYSDDLIPYPGIPSAGGNNIWQIRNFVKNRMNYFDKWVENAPDEEALYTLPSGTYTDNTATLVVSEGNHVAVTLESGEIFASLNPTAVEVTSGSDYTVKKSGWFTLAEGDVVRRVIKNVAIDGDASRSMSQNIASNRGEEKFESGITLSDLGTIYESSKTFTSGCDVGGLILWMSAGNAKLSAEFDIELYVNDVRYI